MTYRTLRSFFAQTQPTYHGDDLPLCTLGLSNELRLDDPTVVPWGHRPRVWPPELVIDHPYPQLLSLIPPLGLKPPHIRVHPSSTSDWAS